MDLGLEHDFAGGMAPWKCMRDKDMQRIFMLDSMISANQ